MADSTSPTLILYEAKSQSHSSSGGSGSSRTRSAVLERIIGQRNGGLELEYRFPEADIPEIDAWKLPARVLTGPGSSIKLLNEPQIEARLENFLERHPEIREHCGGVVFTWTVIEIHCSTKHVVDVIRSYNLNLGRLSEGKLYQEPDTPAAVPLRRVSSDGTYTVFQAELELDPKQLQAGYETEIEQVAKITGKSADSIMNSSLKLTGDEKPRFSGTRLVTIEVTSNGIVERLQRITTIIIVGGGTFQEKRIQDETLTRKPVDQE